MVITQLIANSLIIGSIYALVACGFSLIYSTNKFMHFAHGVTVVIGGYLLYTFFTLLHLPFYLASIVSVILTGLFGVLSYRVIYLPLKNKGSSNAILLMASIGIVILFENVIQLVFGADIKTIGYLDVAKGMDIFGASVTPLQIVIFIIAVVLFVVLYLFMSKTKLGRNMRAVADNSELARIIGINDKRISDYSFFIGSCLAGVAGILVALEQNLFPAMGLGLIIKGFTGAIIGGINFIPGAILGSFILGVAENFGIWYLPSGYKDAIAFGLLFLFLLFKPNGLFGIKKGVKE
jgi:branched-chain amino acid transport system permease protein